MMPILQASEAKPQNSTRWSGFWEAGADRAACATAGFVALAVYLATLAPGLTGEDNGELVAAAWSLGVPHPPGYPLWCLAAYPLMHLVHLGSVAWRGNLVSALFGAVGVCLVAETVLALSGRRIAAVTAGLVLAFSQEYWQQSVIAEIYTIEAVLVALHLMLLARWTRSRKTATLYAAAAVAGLAAAHYTLALALVPLMIVYVFCADLRPRRPSRYLLLLLLILPGWLVYAYLPIRAWADPPMNWGDPGSWRTFADVVSRGQYRDLVVGATPRSVAWVVERLRVFAPVLAWEFTPWVGAGALAGVAALSRVERAFAVYLLAGFCALYAAALAAPNLPLEYHWIWMNTPYWIPAYVFAAVGVGGFVAALQEYGRLPRLFCAVTAAVFVASPLMWNYRENDRRGDRVVSNYAESLLEGMAPNAIYFAGGDHTIFPAVYLQLVEGRRADVLLADRYGYPLPEAYRLVGERSPEGRPPASEDQRLFEALLGRTDRPIYSAIPRECPGAVRVHEGLLYRYLRPGETRRDPLPLPPAPAFDTRGDWSNELVAYEYFAARGRALFDAGKASEALDALDRAARFVHGDKNALNNLGINAAEGGETGAASVYFRRALEADPRFVTAAVNLARCYLLQSAPGDALKLIETLDPADPVVAEMKRAALDAQAGR